jgi:hypothetical protein
MSTEAATLGALSQCARRAVHNLESRRKSQELLISKWEQNLDILQRQRCLVRCRSKSFSPSAFRSVTRKLRIKSPSGTRRRRRCKWFLYLSLSVTLRKTPTRYRCLSECDDAMSENLVESFHSAGYELAAASAIATASLPAHFVDPEKLTPYPSASRCIPHPCTLPHCRSTFTSLTNMRTHKIDRHM